MNRLFISSFTLFTVLLIGSTAWADESESESLNIEAQSLSSALREFSEQTGLQIGYAADIAEGKQTSGVEGVNDPDIALETLLANTDLEHRFVNDETVIIRETAADVQEEGSRDSGNARTAPRPVLMAQNQTTVQQAQNRQARPADDESEEDAPLEMDEIIVTGSQIRGAGTAGANVITLDRKYIEEGGFSTTHDILRSVSQNLGGDGADPSGPSANFAVGSNIGFSSSVNLRGLGTEATLSLVNGRRTAPGGTVGGLTDLNFVPASAIERIEVLADGASATYGSDAIAGVVNITLRDDYEGADTQVRYGPGTSDIEEFQFSQVFGKKWVSGNVMFSYEYFDQSSLKSADRAYTRDSDLTALGGTDYSNQFSNPGNIIQYTAADGSIVNVQLAIPDGQDGTALTPADLQAGVTNLQNIRAGSTVLPAQERHSALLLVSQDLSSEIELSAELRYSQREWEHFVATSSLGNTFTVPNTNPFFVNLDPAGESTSLRVRYSFVDDYGQPRNLGEVETFGATLGLTFDLSNSWELETYASFSSEDTTQTSDQFPNTALLAQALADSNAATAFNMFGDGSHTSAATLTAIEGFTRNELESELSMFNVRADGDLFELPGGAAKLAIGGEFQDQSLGRITSSFNRTLEPVINDNNAATFNLERDIAAAFAELYLPVVSEKNARSGIQKLSVSIAARYEEYSDLGDTFNPKIGISWSPSDSLTFRSTAGTSFRAPFLTQLNATPIAGAFVVTDPASPTGSSRVLWRLGNSPTLQPEEGMTWTAGLDLKPESLPGFSIGLTYFETDLDKKIAVPVGLNLRNEVLVNPESFAPVIARVPEDVGSASVSELLVDCFNCGTLTADDIDAVIDGRLGNLIKSDISGVDFDVEYALETDLGAISTSISGTYLIDFEEQALVNGPFEDQLDTLTTPNSLKIRGTLGWNRGGLYSALYGNYIRNYDSDSGPSCSVQACRIPSWTTWDLYLGYEFGEHNLRLLRNAKVSLNVVNVFDRDPPFVEVGGFGLAYNPVNSNALGQHLTLQVSKQW